MNKENEIRPAQREFDLAWQEFFKDKRLKPYLIYNGGKTVSVEELNYSLKKID